MVWLLWWEPQLGQALLWQGEARQKTLLEPVQELLQGEAAALTGQ